MRRVGVLIEESAPNSGESPRGVGIDEIVVGVVVVEDDMACEQIAEGCGLFGKELTFLEEDDVVLGEMVANGDVSPGPTGEARGGAGVVVEGGGVPSDDAGGRKSR